MKTPTSVEHRFVEQMPADLVERVLYVSIEYSTAVHLCACGCGNKVVTPLSPAEWSLTFDGDSVSLSPSIGNWQFPCRSHYWIKGNHVRWAAAWSEGEVARGQVRDARDLEKYFDMRQTLTPAPTPPRLEEVIQRPRQDSWWRRFFRRSA